MSSAFSYARIEGFPTQHEENKTPVTVDVLESGLIAAFVILGFTFLLVTPGARGMARLYLCVRVILSLFIGAVIIIGNIGQEWEVGHIHTGTPYKAGSAAEIKADIGMKLGLRSVNITLKRTDKNDTDSLRNEIINYNERFTWAWDQGRFGFGPYAGRLQQEFRAAQIKGLPLPILWVADYFTWDGEGLRFGRYYRTAGWYSHIALWCAFPSWLIANFMFLSVVQYGGYFTVLTGALQLLACLLWTVIRNPLELSIPFEDGEMTTTYGSSFWLTMFSGVLSLILGLVVVILDLRFPHEVALFFGTDPLADYEELHLTESELELLRNKGKKHRHEFDMVELNSEYVSSDGPPEPKTQVVLQRRTTVRRAQKGLLRTPVGPLTHQDDELPVYLNVPQPGYSEDAPHGSRQRLY